MRIGMIGAGSIGSTLAELLVRAGHDVTLSHDGPPEELRELVEHLGDHASAGTNTEAAQSVDVVVLALPFGRYAEVAPEPFHGKIVVDAMNYFPERDGRFAEIDDGRLTSSELVARHFDPSRLVKAWNNLPMNILAERVRPKGAPNRLALPVSSDSLDAKRVVEGLVDQTGCDPVDVGGLVGGGRLQQQGGPLFLRPLTAAELLATVGAGGEQPLAP